MPRAWRQLAAAACAGRAADPLPPDMPPSYLPTGLQQGPSGHTCQPKHGSPYATPYQDSRSHNPAFVLCFPIACSGRSILSPSR